MLTPRKNIGNFGEQLARDFLVRRGLEIVASNQKIGRWEIDLIAHANGHHFFIEVKTLSAGIAIPAETALTRRQIEILHRAIQKYCWHHNINHNNCQLDFISINLDRGTKTAKLKYYQNVF